MRFRKKPVVIEAEQYYGSMPFPRGVCTLYHDNPEPGVSVGMNFPHLHTMHAGQSVYLQPGDWVIPEPDGEHFYPCKPDVFAATYEPLAPPQETPTGMRTQIVAPTDFDPEVLKRGAEKMRALREPPTRGPSQEMDTAIKGWAERKAKGAPGDCLITGHPCGSDTYQEGLMCACGNCVTWAYVALPPSPPQALPLGHEYEGPADGRYCVATAPYAGDDVRYCGLRRDAHSIPKEGDR